MSCRSTLSDQTTGSDAVNKSERQIPLRRRVAYVLVIYLTFVLILLAVEMGTRLTLAHIPSLDLFVNTPQQKAQVADAHQSAIFEGDPLLLWRLKPSLNHVVWDFTVVSTNAESFRSDYPVSAKQSGVFRIVCLGDSVTFGYRVPAVWPERPTEYNAEWLPYPMLLERKLREANPDQKIEVIAMAVPGYTSHQGLAWLRRDIDTLQPDLLTVSFGWNDVSMSDSPDREAIHTDWYAVTVRWLIDHSQAFAHATKWLRSGKQVGPSAAITPQPRVSEQEYLDNLLAISKLASERGAKTIVIAAPYRDRFTNGAEAELMIRYRRSLRSLAERNKIPFLEILELTEAAYPANEGWFGELIHPNHMGHRLITSELLELLAKDRLLEGLAVPTLTP